jgi:hypothetical protein
MQVRLKDELTNTEITLRNVTRVFYNEDKDEIQVYRIMDDGREGLITYRMWYIIGVLA